MNNDKEIHYSKALNLSRLQLAMLDWLLREIRQVESERQMVQPFVRWAFFADKREGKPETESRATSRALLRLEQRGLVLRASEQAGVLKDLQERRQTTHVGLTATGRRIAEMIAE